MVTRGGGGAYPDVIFFGDTERSERGAAPPPGRVPRFRDPSDGPPRDVHVNFRAPTPDVGVAKKMTSGVRTPTTPRPQEAFPTPRARAPGLAPGPAPPRTKRGWPRLSLLYAPATQEHKRREGVPQAGVRTADPRVPKW